MTKEDYMEVLNWMFSRNIIDHLEYNELLLKGLPFTV